MRPIPPSMQESYRYLEFKVRGDQKDLGEVVDAVWCSATKYMGANNSSKAEIWIIGNKFSEKKQIGVIRTQKTMEEELRAAIALNPCFDDETFLSIEKVSGTLSGIGSE